MVTMLTDEMISAWGKRQLRCALTTQSETSVRGGGWPRVYGAGKNHQMNCETTSSGDVKTIQLYNSIQIHLAYFRDQFDNNPDANQLTTLVRKRMYLRIQSEWRCYHVWHNKTWISQSPRLSNWLLVEDCTLIFSDVGVPRGRKTSVGAGELKTQIEYLCMIYVSSGLRHLVGQAISLLSVTVATYIKTAIKLGT